MDRSMQNDIAGIHDFFSFELLSIEFTRPKFVFQFYGMKQGKDSQVKTEGCIGKKLQIQNQ